MPTRLRDLLGSVGERLGMRDAAATGIVWERWSEIVGAQVAEHAEPTSLRAGVLRVRTGSPAWATEIGYFAPEIVRRINEVAGGQLVDSVKVWTAPGPMEAARKGSALAAAETSHDPRSEVGGDDPVAALRAARAAWARTRARGRKTR